MGRGDRPDGFQCCAECEEWISDEGGYGIQCWGCCQTFVCNDCFGNLSSYNRERWIYSPEEDNYKECHHCGSPYFSPDMKITRDVLLQKAVSRLGLTVEQFEEEINQERTEMASKIGRNPQVLKEMTKSKIEETMSFFGQEPKKKREEMVVFLENYLKEGECSCPPCARDCGAIVRGSRKICSDCQEFC